MATILNDVHSQLNETAVDRILRPGSIDELRAALRAAANEGKAVSVSGGRHCMGGQQFAAGAVHLDMSGFNRLVSFDAARGLIEVEAGMQWPALALHLAGSEWALIQKPTGADRISIGGSISANSHGRGLKMKPLAADVESFQLMDAAGTIRRCSREKNAELFRLAIGGYGLFGILVSAVLRLTSKTRLEIKVELAEADGLVKAFDALAASGCRYGIFRYSTVPDPGEFLKKGVLLSYRPVPVIAPLRASRITEDELRDFLYLAHTDRRRAYAGYFERLLSQSGSVVESDRSQMNLYLDGYHEEIDRKIGAANKGSEMITEVYVPPEALGNFLGKARRFLLAESADVIYGSLRVIEQDDESFLPWARERYACVGFNLHVEHSPAGIDRARMTCSSLIGLAVELGGSYLPAFHRWATAEQVKAAFPRFQELLRLKKQFDPEERFQSEWYRHYKRTLV